MESMKSSPSRVCERGDGEPRAVSAQRSRQQAGSNAEQVVGYAAEATEAGRAAEHSVRGKRRGARSALHQAQQRRWYCISWERIQYNR